MDKHEEEIPIAALSEAAAALEPAEEQVPVPFIDTIDPELQDRVRAKMEEVRKPPTLAELIARDPALPRGLGHAKYFGEPEDQEGEAGE